MNKKSIINWLVHGLNALAATILIIACIHLAIALVSFLVTLQVDYINPIDFLGLGIVWPRYLHSETATLIAWLFLIISFVAIFIIHGRLRVSVAITKKPKRATALAKEPLAAKPNLNR